MSEKVLPARCDYCGRFIADRDFETGQATITMVLPDSEYTKEEWETACRLCKLGGPGLPGWRRP